MHAILSTDGWVLFGTRAVRMFAYGFLSVVFVLYLTEVGLSTTQIGLLLTLTLIGDAILSLGMTITADHLGRRRMLIAGAGLMLLAGILFASTNYFILLLFAATVGVISPSGYEVGPFLSIEQASLSQIVPDQRRTQVFAWYNLVGSFATALGALVGGVLAELTNYHIVLLGYTAMGAVLTLLFLKLSPAVEVETRHVAQLPWIGLNQSRSIVLKLAALFSLDAFAGGFILQSVVAYWFYLRFKIEPAMLGGVFFVANILAGISSLVAARLALRIGLINTMVWTHIPSNILLILVPLMPNLGLTITLLWLRFSISQMDVPARQSYTMAAVNPNERSAAAGITNIARTVGAALAPIFTSPLLGSAALLGTVFFISGGLKIVYDLLLYRNFRMAVKKF